MTLEPALLINNSKNSKHIPPSSLKIDLQHYGISLVIQYIIIIYHSYILLHIRTQPAVLWKFHSEMTKNCGQPA
jgi:hypothetical protein